MKETIEERVRNVVSPFYNMASMIKNIENRKVEEYIIDNCTEISKTMINCIKYLIDIANIIDKNMPKEFDINKELDKTKYNL